MDHWIISPSKHNHRDPTQAANNTTEKQNRKAHTHCGWLYQIYSALGQQHRQIPSTMQIPPQSNTKPASVGIGITSAHASLELADEKFRACWDNGDMLRHLHRRRSRRLHRGRKARTDTTPTAICRIFFKVKQFDKQSQMLVFHCLSALCSHCQGHQVIQAPKRIERSEQHARRRGNLQQCACT